MSRRDTLADVGEFGLLATLLPRIARGRDVIVGPGDDCAVVQTRSRRLLFTVDALVEGVHFRRRWLTPAQLGRKAFLINASDIAAMGGTPRWCVLHLSATPRTAAADLASISRGVAAAAAAAGAALVGGNLSRAAELSATVALIGDAPRRRALTRAGAQPGDCLYVTGALGEAALGVRDLTRSANARGPAVRRFRQPPVRLRAGALLARSGMVSAMIDVSDGLLQDLGHLCAASRVGARIRLESIPCSERVRRAGMELALAGGEDYELLCAVPERNRDRVQLLAAHLGCPFTEIGACAPTRTGVRVVDARGHDVPVSIAGFDHFAPRRRR